MKDEDDAVVEIMARALCQSQGTDPDARAYTGVLWVGPMGSHVLPAADSPSIVPAWRTLEAAARRALHRLRVNGYTIIPPQEDASPQEAA